MDGKEPLPYASLPLPQPVLQDPGSAPGASKCQGWLEVKLMALPALLPIREGMGIRAILLGAGGSTVNVSAVVNPCVSWSLTSLIRASAYIPLVLSDKHLKSSYIQNFKSFQKIGLNI